MPQTAKKCPVVILSEAPLNGDNRIAIGIMLAVCEHCGLD